jgi:hypothetical protein
MDKKFTARENTYRIKVREVLDPTSTEWFDGMTVTPLEDGATLLTGTFPDQPALRGFIDQLWNLNLTVLSVEKVGNGFHQEPHPG